MLGTRRTIAKPIAKPIASHAEPDKDQLRRASGEIWQCAAELERVMAPNAQLVKLTLFRKILRQTDTFPFFTVTKDVSEIKLLKKRPEHHSTV